jgi:hypothetical protein
VREQLKELTKQYDKSENDLKALQSVGQVCAADSNQGKPAIKTTYFYFFRLSVKCSNSLLKKNVTLLIIP